MLSKEDDDDLEHDASLVRLTEKTMELYILDEASRLKVCLDIM